MVGPALGFGIALVATSSLLAQVAPPDTCPTVVISPHVAKSEISKKGGGCDTSGTSSGPTPNDGGTGCAVFEPYAPSGYLYQDFTHPSTWTLSNGGLISQLRTLTIGSNTGKESSYPLKVAANPTNPPAITAYEGNTFELQGQNPPGEATLRDFFGVTLSSGQLDVSLPTGISFKGVNGNDFELKINLRSSMQRRAQLGPFASFNYEDFLVVDLLVPMTGVNCAGTDQPSESALRNLVNSAPYISRLKGGALESWTNIGEPANPPGSHLTVSGCYSNVGDNAFGVVYHNNSNCFFAKAGAANALTSASQVTSFYIASQSASHVQHASHVSDPTQVHPNECNYPPTSPPLYCFVPPLGTLETLDWDCDGSVITEANGTQTVYSRFYVQKSEVVCVGPGADQMKPPGNGGQGLVPPGTHSPSVEEKKVHLRLVAPAMFRQTRDGLRLWYLYNVYGQLIGWRDVLGREVGLIYGSLGDGSAQYAVSANTVYAIRAEDGRECNLMYKPTAAFDPQNPPTDYDPNEGTLTDIFLPDVGAGAPGQTAIAPRNIRVDIHTLKQVPRPGQYGPTCLKSPKLIERYYMGELKIAAPLEPEVAGSENWTFDAQLESVGDPPYTGCRVKQVTYASNRAPSWLSGPVGTKTTYDYLKEGNLSPCDLGTTWKVTETIYPAASSDSTVLGEVKHRFDNFGNEIQRDEKVVLSTGAGETWATTNYEFADFAQFINIKTGQTDPDGTHTTWDYQFQADGGPSHWYDGISFNAFNSGDQPFFAKLNVLHTTVTGTGSLPASLVTDTTYRWWQQVASESYPHAVGVSSIEKYHNYFDYDAPIAEPVRGAIVRTVHDPSISSSATTTFEHNDFAQTTKATDSLGRVTAFTYLPMNDPDGDGSPNWKTTDGLAPEELPGYLKDEVVDPPPSGSGSSTTPLNLVTSHRYDIRGNETQTIFPKGDRMLAAYNGMDQAYLIAKGSFTVGTGGDPVESAPGAGFSKEYRLFDANGNVTEVKKLNDNPATNTLTTTTNYVSTRFTYDGLDRLVQADAELASPTTSGIQWAKTKWLRDPLGRITREVRPDGSVTSVSYAPQGKVLTNKVFTNRLTVGSDPTSEPGTSTSDGSMSLAYDSMGRLVQGTDGAGDHETMYYDGLGRPIGRRDPQNTLLYQELSDLGQPLTESIFTSAPDCPPAGGATLLQKTEYDYDNRFRLHLSKAHRFTDGNGTHQVFTTTYEYDSENQFTQVADAKGGVSNVEYDRAGRKTKDIYPNLLNDDTKRNVDTTTYDANGNVTKLEIKEWGIPDGGTATSSIYTIDHEYDALNRETKTIRAKGTALEAANEMTYDSLSNPRRVKEPKTGQVVGTQHWFDTLGRSVKTVEGYDQTFTQAAAGLATVSANSDGFVTLLTNYDLAGNVVEQKDDRDNATSYQYDGQQRRTQVTYADATYETVSYRKDGLAEHFDAYSTGHAHLYGIQYSYGTGSESKRKVAEQATHYQGVYSGVWSKTFAYDELGRVTHAEAESEDPHTLEHSILTKTDRTYDSLGRVLTDGQSIFDQTTTTGPWTSVFAATVTSSYDELGNLKESVSNYGSENNEFKLHRDYDALSRLTNVSQITGNGNLDIADYEWRGARGRIETIRHPWNTTKTIYSNYDLRGRVGAITTQFGSSVLAGKSYGYGPSSVKTYELKTGGTTAWQKDDHVFTHDALDRLTKFRQGDYTSSTDTFALTPTVKTEQLDMDGAGSILTHKVPATGGAQTTYTNVTDTTNQYISGVGTDGNLAGTFDNQEVERDERGNTIAIGIMNLAFDVYGHVVGTMRPYVTPIVPTVEFCDAFDRRVYRDFNGEKRAFVFQDEELLEELVLNPPSGPAPQVSREYVHGSGIDELVAQRVNGVLYVMHTDAMGTPYAATKQNSTVSELYDVGPYGEYSTIDVDGGGVIGNRIGLAGMWYDSVTNLYYMRARHYSPFMKRFVSRDPLGVWGDIAGIGNAYQYGAFSPLRCVDPSGLISWDECKDAFAGAVRGAIDKSVEIGAGIGGYDGPLPKLGSDGTIAGDAGYYGGAATVPVARDVAAGAVDGIANAPGDLVKLAVTVATVGNISPSDVPIPTYSPGAHALDANQNSTAYKVGEFAGPVAATAGAGALVKAASTAVKAASAASKTAALVDAAEVAETAVTAEETVSTANSAAKTGAQLSKEAQKGIRSLEKQIAKHEEKLEKFKANPTPRPGTEQLSQEIQQKSIDRRIQHLQKEIRTFRSNIEKLRGDNK